MDEGSVNDAGPVNDGDMLNGPDRVRLRSRPQIGERVPGWALRVAVVAVGVALCVSQLPLGLWFGFGLALALLAGFFPRVPAAWGLIIVLGAGLLWRQPSPLDLHFYLLLAGVHLLHVLASFALAVPVRACLQLRALGAPLRRYLLIQVPVQLGAGIALFVFSPRIGHAAGVIPAAAAVAAVALVVLTVILTGPLLRAKLRN
ncbi:MAG TPA: hypothetical protein VIJ18_13710 [Microbacteriaceae bacterium]